MSIFNTQHIGKFELAFSDIAENPELIQGVFANVIPIEATPCVARGVIVYTAISEENFSAVEPGHLVPEYSIDVVVSEGEDGGAVINFVKMGS